MIYVVKKKTKTYKAISELLVKGKEVRKAINHFCNKYKTGKQYYEPHSCWEGIEAVLFDNVQAEPDRKLWKSRTIDGRRAWIPKITSGDLHKEFSAIPKVWIGELSKILKYDWQTGPPSGRGHGFVTSLNPGFEVISKDIYIVTTEEWVKWRPNGDLKEITMKEFEKMKK